MLQPKDLIDALKYLSKIEDIIPFAGGTDLMVSINKGMFSDKVFLDLSTISELQQFIESKDVFIIGSMCTFSQIIQNKVVNKYFPVLYKASKNIGSYAIQNRGTIGGNIANASPAGDALPALLIYNARLKLVSIDGIRIVEYKDFHLDYKKTILKKTEIIYQIILPKKKKEGKHYFNKVALRKAQAISILSCAALINIKNKLFLDFRLSFGAVGKTPIRCFKVESKINGKMYNKISFSSIIKVLNSEIDPISDFRASSLYRKKVAINIILYLLKSKNQ